MSTNREDVFEVAFYVAKMYVCMYSSSLIDMSERESAREKRATGKQKRATGQPSSGYLLILTDICCFQQ